MTPMEMAAEVLLSEGLHQDATSRAYYAMFRAARVLLASKDLHPRTHGGVLQQIGRHFVLPGLLGREVVEDLGYALQLRQRADDDVDLAVTEVDARGLVERANRFVQVVRRGPRGFLMRVDALGPGAPMGLVERYDLT